LLGRGAERLRPLMQFGHNRDGKRDLPIMVYGVLY
jgi:transposase